ncbi:carbon storage regulator CsrA [Nocardioides mangrovi]|uniref:Translational regulator CsrA n=1 Tax=Nocardioides mangrovi TaxID=2874580 RepID=A0ABS7UA96_9ACTN|nr:carbon storage regulator CsrA [Nocardioides mangrovi]MBZ5737797.1 carbon storage regulator CsrA [Nocardioides mangrovi]
MLVLSRRAGESVVLGDDITVTVLEVRGDVVRVGIDAPRSLKVHRAELLAQLEESNRQSASPDDDTVARLSEALHRDKDADPARDGGE